MKRRTSLAIVLAVSLVNSLSAQSLWKEPKNASWKSATGAGQYEQLLWKAAKEKDWLAVESHIASNFVFVDATGTKDKAQRVADLKQAPPTDTDIKDANVTPSGDHAIVTYTLGTSHVMSIWQQQKAGWVLVAMAVTAK